jgi:hypothetical protein
MPAQEGREPRSPPPLHLHRELGRRRLGGRQGGGYGGGGVAVMELGFRLVDRLEEATRGQRTGPFSNHYAARQSWTRVL